MSKAKDMLVQHNKKGAVKLGSLSFNEICRLAAQLLLENAELQRTLQEAYDAYVAAKEGKDDTK